LFTPTSAVANRPTGVPLTLTTSEPTTPTKVAVPLICATNPPLNSRVTTDSPLTLTGFGVIVALRLGDTTW